MYLYCELSFVFYLLQRKYQFHRIETSIFKIKEKKLIKNVCARELLMMERGTCHAFIGMTRILWAYAAELQAARIFTNQNKI